MKSIVTHTSHIRVRYAETDQMGVLYYGNYAAYYEVGRVELMRALGVRYKTLEEQGIFMPVIEMHSKYIRPVKYDELIRIETSIQEMPDRDITFHCALYNEENILLNKGRVRLCFYDRAEEKRMRAPQLLMENLLNNNSADRK